MFLLFTILLFEKNGAAAIRPKAPNFAQLVENQRFSPPEGVSKKIEPPRPDVKKANRKAKAALVFGLLGCAMFVPAMLAGSQIAVVLMVVYPILAIFLGLIAFKEKTSRGMAAAWGICLGLTSWVLVKVASTLGGGE